MGKPPDLVADVVFGSFALRPVPIYRHNTVP